MIELSRCGEGRLHVWKDVGEAKRGAWLWKRQALPTRLGASALFFQLHITARATALVPTDNFIALAPPPNTELTLSLSPQLTASKLVR